MGTVARRHLIPASTAALLAVIGAVALADRSPAASEPPRVMVATTGNHSERVRTIPISRRQGAAKRVVISMKPREVPDFQGGDRIKVTAEVQFTVNCLESSRGCVGPPYGYNPIVRTALVLAKGASTTAGRRAMSISRPKRNVCRQRHPAREHHCVVTFTDAGFTVRDGERLPCSPATCRINLVASAHNRRAGSRDLLAVGGLHKNGSISQDRGRINAIRFHPASQPPIAPVTTDTPIHSRVPSKHPARVIYSVRLDHLRAGEQLDVSAALRTSIAGLPYNVRHSSQLVLAGRRTAPHPNDAVRDAVGLGGEIDELNLFNCTRNRPRCVIKKVGVARIKHDVDRPLFVNLYTSFSPKRRERRPGDRVRIVRGGGLRVVRYPPEVRG